MTKKLKAEQVTLGNGDPLIPQEAKNHESPAPQDPPTVASLRPTSCIHGIPTKDLVDYLPDVKDRMAMFGTKTETGATGLLITALNSLGEGGASFRDFVLSMGAELEPRDAIEAMIVTQIAASHAGLSDAMGRMWDARDRDAREAYVRMVGRLGQAFSNQVEALRRHRAGGMQTVRVDHVTVKDGGQAIVGNVYPGKAAQ